MLTLVKPSLARISHITWPVLSRKMATKSSCRFQYFLVLDFEATCDEPHQPEPQEIIEFPCLKFDTEKLQTTATFHSYVAPKIHPNLSSFCTQLTGIVQEMVNDEPDFKETIEKFLKWLDTENLLHPDGTGRLASNAAFLTCGDWDLKSMMTKQCRASGIPIPDCFSEWINLKKVYFQTERSWPRGMIWMLQNLGIPHEGRHHSGIDDSKNIANIAKYMVEKGADFSITSSRQDK